MANKNKDAAGLTAKQRAFVLLIVQGKSQSDAYRAAYGKPDSYDGAVARVRGCEVAALPAVKAEIERMKADITERVRASAAAKHAITVDYVMARLHEVTERCLQHRPVLDGKGNPVKVEVRTPDGLVELRALYTFDAKGATQSLGLIGKQLGMFVERKEIRTGPLPDKSDREVDELLLALIQDLAASTGADPATLVASLGAHQAPPTTDPTPTPQGGSASARDGTRLLQ